MRRSSSIGKEILRLRGQESSSARGLALAACLASVLFTLQPIARGQSNNPCDQPGEAPDLIVGGISAKTRWGSVGGITAFSVGVYSCNVGTCWLNWITNTPEHPVIGQNMFRLKDGRFEQIGQSWLRHTIPALSQTLCTTGCIATDGTHLGVNCSDTNSASINGAQYLLGPKFEVNASTGVFPFPASNMSQTGDAIYKRLQAHNADLDPALNPGALYWVEVQSVTRDDAAAGNLHNNASYRPIIVNGFAGNFDFTLSGTTVRAKPAIEAWKASDPEVALTDAFVPADGRFIVGARVTSA
ncbi:MAG: hypothetical protein ACREDF_06535, partial [Thermoplasmata archaeon]